jgi:predicted Zn-dependent protease
LLGTVLVIGLGSANVDAAAPDTSALAKAGEQLLQKNDAKGAEAQFRQAVLLAPNDAGLRIQLARVYLKQNNLHAAEAELTLVKQKRLLADKSDYTNVEWSEQLDATLAEILFREGESATLLRDIPAGNRAPQLESTVRTYRGLAGLGLGQRATAQTMLQDAERLDPTSMAAKVATARLLLATDDLTAAERKINDVLKAAPRDSDALQTKGSIVLAAGKTDEALTYFSNALKEDPSNEQALLNRAKLYIRKGDLDHANEDVRLLQNSDTTRWMSIYLHATIAVLQHDYKSADVALTRFRPAMDRMPEAYLLAGIVKYNLNQFSQADDYLTRYIAHDKGRARAYQVLGAVALKQGNPKRAVEMLDQALKLAPNDEESLRFLAEAKKASSG